MLPVVNIAAYKFVELCALPTLRQTLHDAAESRQLKGTVLLAEEGINLFLAGDESAIEGFVVWLRAHPELVDIEIKYSRSAAVPFKKLLVKIKREIIRMNHPTIRPEKGRAPVVDAHTLQRWLARGSDDDGRPLALLDTRNAFEVDAGTFDQAIDWRIERFSEFPAAAEAHRAELEGKTVVSFCTGGIRCEKAAIYLSELGLQHVYQLDGGILRFFETTDGRGYSGDCFVFDERRHVNQALDVVEPTAT